MKNFAGYLLAWLVLVAATAASGIALGQAGWVTAVATVVCAVVAGVALLRRAVARLPRW